VNFGRRTYFEDGTAPVGEEAVHSFEGCRAPGRPQTSTPTGALSVEQCLSGMSSLRVLSVVKMLLALPKLSLRLFGVTD
jgi:hypothetical protein